LKRNHYFFVKKNYINWNFNKWKISVKLILFYFKKSIKHALNKINQIEYKLLI
jgi:hypothetical protein